MQGSWLRWPGMTGQVNVYRTRPSRLGGYHPHAGIPSEKQKGMALINRSYAVARR
jgi:hypothetical protein